MSSRPSEQTEVHTRLLRFSLGTSESRAFWSNVTPGQQSPTPLQAFEQHWFGARSQTMVKNIIRSLRVRYEAYPDALAVLHRWQDMSPDTRRLICHWHLQLSDPIYRDFTGQFLRARRNSSRADLTRNTVVRWVEENHPDRWSPATVTKWASVLLTTAHDAGLVKTARDPRQLSVPRVPDDALGYCLHLLRGIDIEGTLTENPYLSSVGLSGAVLEDRLRTLPLVTFHRMGELVEFRWDAKDLSSWAKALT